MSALWAIAGKMIQEAIRRKTLLLILIFVLLLIPVLPLILRHDGTLKGQLQLILNYSISLAVFLLACQSVFLAISSFTGELKSRQFFLIDSKPVARWKFFMGKFLGLAVINFLSILLFAFFISLALYFAFIEGEKSEQKKIREEFFRSVRGISPDIPYKRVEEAVEAEYKKLIRERRLPDNQTPRVIKENLRSMIIEQAHVIPFSYTQTWIFKDIPISLKEDPKTQLRLRFKLFTSRTTATSDCQTSWIIGSRGLLRRKNFVQPGEFHELAVGVEHLGDDGTLVVTFQNQHKEAGIFYFPPQDGIEILYPESSFWVNYGKSMILLFAVLQFLVTMSLFFSTFLSFPIAIFASGYFLLMGMMANLVLHLVSSGSKILAREFAKSAWEVFAHKILLLFFQMLPNFSRYIAIENLASGRIIEWTTMGEGILILLSQGCILAFLGCYLFRHKEVGNI